MIIQRKKYLSDSLQTTNNIRMTKTTRKHQQQLSIKNEDRKN